MTFSFSSFVCGFLLIALINGLWMGSVTAQAARPEGRYITGLQNCLPASALSHQTEADKWRLIPYHTAHLAGTMVVAPSFINAPDIRLPLNASGWQDIYIGYWNPEFASDDDPILKLKLSGEPAFRIFCVPATSDTQDATFLREVHLGAENVTGRDLVIGKSNGLEGHSSYIAYVRLVPLTREQVQQVKADRSRTDTRNLVATIDGMSYFHFSQFTTPENILELVEPYRHSDVAKVLWAATYGAMTNYPTKVDGALFIAGDQSRAALNPGGGSNDYVIGERQMYESLRNFADKDEIPQQIAAKAVHKMGLKFDLMFRLGMIEAVPGIGPIWGDDGNFIQRFPQYRQVLRDGTVLAKASYAFPQVRRIQLNLIREALEKIDADGINLCFVRAPHFLQYEQPVLEAFKAKYHEDARKVSPSDPRLGEIRATFMTDFVQQVRNELDEIGRKKNKPLELSVWVWPSGKNVWLGGTPMEEGLDVQSWVREGLLNSVICQGGIDPKVMSLCKDHHCKFILFTGYRGDEAMSPKSVTQAYEQGVNDFAYWDIDGAQMMPHAWEWIRRIGHRKEMADWNPADHEPKSIRLIDVGGTDVLHGMAQSIYSGG